MAWTVAAAFAQFEATILPNGPQITSLQPKINTATGYLSRAFPPTSNMPLDLSRTKLIGSAAQGTLIRPVDDIDLLAVFDDSSNIWEDNYISNSHAFMQRIRGSFGSSHIQTIGVRGQAVRLFYKSGAHVDIAPVFWATDGGYLLPSGDGKWIRTDPDAQAQWFKTQDQRLSNHLLPMIRLLKRWNSIHGKQLKSYHLAVMVANVFGTLGANHADAAAKFFAWAPAYIDSLDPAGYSGNLAANMSANARLTLRTRLAHAAQRANNAQAAALRGDHREAVRLWTIEFGSEFPAYG